MPEMLWPIAPGFLLGLVFYGGLWWTVQHVSDFPQPALIVLGSSLLRFGAVIAAFYFVGVGDWRRVLLCLLGFLIARLVVTWVTRLPSPATETGDAP